MKWIKRGLVYKPDARMPWARHSALTPTPIVLGDTIRVFAGFRDDAGVSRIGYVDVSADNPRHVIGVSRCPVLDTGRGGMFDDNGLILGDVVEAGDEWRMYYVGFQLVHRAKFLAFSGLAISRDGCRSFRKIGETPVLDRAEEGPFIRTLHSVRYHDGVWKAWYAAGRDWERIADTPYPRYEIRYIESRDGLIFPDAGEHCIAPQGDEYRIGRPRVDRENGRWRMLFTFGTRSGDYLPGYAESEDGRKWRRNDDRVGITLSSAGWDSRTLCYLAPIRAAGRTYAFYNGNDMGRNGFGYAELADD
jgi:hypothetical protein